MLKDCILCGEPAPTSQEQAPYTIAVKPRCAGVRLLALDGGGVRGIVEILVLRAIQEEINLKVDIPIRAFFDLIVGTSTGKLSLNWKEKLTNYSD
jgi:hypothetical protein